MENNKQENLILPKIVKLKSGLEAILVSLKETQAVMIMVLVKTGSEYETKEQNGISHFLEHMCFKGTKKRPTTKEISIFMDRLGANFNAFTSQEHTGFFAEVHYKQLANALDIISDIYQNPLITQEEIDKEKGVVMEEITLDEDMPTSQIYDLFIKLLYGDQPAGWRVFGEKEIISKITKEDLELYLKNHYTVDKTLIVVSGRIDEAETINLLDQAFSQINQDKGLSKFPTKERQIVPRVSIKNKKTDQTHLILGFRAFSKFDQRKHILAVLSAILGSGYSSRLFQRVREEMGAAYYIHSIVDLSIDHGFFGVAAGVALIKTDDVIRVIYEEFKKIVVELVDEEELQKAKDYIRGKMTLGLESSDEYAFFYGLQYLSFGKVFSLEDIFNEIDAVTPQKIQELAKELFQPKNTNLIILGPFKKKDETHFKNLLK